MIDAQLRRLLDAALADLGRRAAGLGISADWLTAAASLAGIAAMLTISRSHFWIGASLILLNRTLDGLDGAVARATRLTDRGAYLDALGDALLFAGVPFGFALASPERAVAAVFLVFGMIVLGSASRTLAGQRGVSAQTCGPTMGLVLTLAYAFSCLMPGWFSIVAYVLGIAHFVLAGMQVASAVNKQT
jgi:phosphatidylglycerophosphate synthase